MGKKQKENANTASENGKTKQITRPVQTKQGAPSNRGNAARQSGNRRPKPRPERGAGAKRTAEVLVSLVLVAIVGYQGVRLYRSMVPISQGVENSVVLSTEEATEATEPSPVYDNIAVDNTEVHAGDLILVNNQYAYTESNPSEIVSVYEYKNDNYHVSGTETSLREQAITALNSMLKDFYVAKGLDDIIVISGYRTNEQQQSLYDADLEETGEETSTKVAKPGYSEHETGYALDVSLYQDGMIYDYDGTEDYEWINQNAAHYGYILRYAEDKTDTTGIQAEPWHYRYVGQPHATYMYENNLCLEEYMTLLKNYGEDNHLSITNWDGEIYEVYYVPADASSDTTYVLVPSDQDYTISGNNTDGFIVTVDTGEIQTFDAEATENAVGAEPEEESASETEQDNAG